jgi:alkaline phosphatase D
MTITNIGRYLNHGNSKFGALTIENLADGEQSSLKYTLYIDGEEKWNTIVLTPEVIAGAKPTVSLWDRIRGGV